MKDQRFEMRLSAELLARLDAWRALQPVPPTRAAAVRRFTEDFLRRSEVFGAVDRQPNAASKHA